MNRYIVVQTTDRLNSSTQSFGSGYLVVDVTGSAVMADCGREQGIANKVAQALNALDGGPLS